MNWLFCWEAIKGAWSGWRRRDDTPFEQLKEINAEAFNQLKEIKVSQAKRIEALEAGQSDTQKSLLALLSQNGDQQHQLNDCRENHRECDEERKTLTAQHDALKAEVADMKAKLLPGGK